MRGRAAVAHDDQRRPLARRRLRSPGCAAGSGTRARCGRPRSGSSIARGTDAARASAQSSPLRASTSTRRRPARSSDARRRSSASRPATSTTPSPRAQLGIVRRRCRAAAILAAALARCAAGRGARSVLAADAGDVAVGRGSRRSMRRTPIAGSPNSASIVQRAAGPSLAVQVPPAAAVGDEVELAVRRSTPAGQTTRSAPPATRRASAAGRRSGASHSSVPSHGMFGWSQLSHASVGAVGRDAGERVEVAARATSARRPRRRPGSATSSFAGSPRRRGSRARNDQPPVGARRDRRRSAPARGRRLGRDRAAAPSPGSSR